MSAEEDHVPRSRSNEDSPQRKTDKVISTEYRVNETLERTGRKVKYDLEDA